jgi:hypothetical protein
MPRRAQVPRLDRLIDELRASARGIPATVLAQHTGKHLRAVPAPTIVSATTSSAIGD